MSGQSWGGSEALWSKTAMLALEEGHDVFVSVYRWDSLRPPLIDLKKKGAQIHFRTRFSHNVPFTQKILRFIKNRFPAFQDTWNPLFEFQPDCVLVNQGASFDLAVHHKNLFEEIAKREIKLDLICHSHHAFGDIPASNIYPSAQAIFKYATSVFVVSCRMKLTIQRQLCMQLSNAIQIWNPLNITKNEYIPYPDGAVPNFAVVGNLADAKGHDTLFEVLSVSIWHDRDWKLNIYGAGYGEQYLRDLAKYFGIEEKVVFCGHVSSATEIWANNHLLIIPSAGEGLPISLCEAMICGRTAVVTDVGGNAEMITDGQNGFVAEAPSVYSVGKAMERAWAQKEHWIEMGKTARTSAIEKIDLKPEGTLLMFLSK